MFQIYLPIAELSVNLLVMLGLGAAVGFLSGMFGVGGGFLITPLLIFYSIPPSIAVATGANQIVATSVSGALAQWRRGTYRLQAGQRAARRRRGRRADRRVPAQAPARGRPARPDHLADLRGPARHHRQPDAGREHRAPSAARAPASLPRRGSPASTTGSTAAAEAALSALAALYQRHPAAGDRLGASAS